MAVVSDPISALLTALPKRSFEGWSSTSVEKTLWPPRRGTRHWHRLFGSRLVCVRYRYSSDRKHRYTTVELLVDHGSITHKPTGRPGFAIRLADGERQLAAQLAASGGRWDVMAGHWLVKAAVVRRLKLQARAKKLGRMAG